MSGSNGRMVSSVLAWWLLVTLVIIGVYDVWALLTQPVQHTVSYVLWMWGRENPALYLFVGLVVGHIIFPLRVNGTAPPPLP